MDAQKHRLAKFGLDVPSAIDDDDDGDERQQGKRDYLSRSDLQSI